jgi:transposase
MDRKAVTTILDNLKPAIDAVTDDNVKTIIKVLISLIHGQQEVIEAQQRTIQQQQQTIEQQQQTIETQHVLIKEQHKEIQELKEKLGTNSSNSSKPPSGDPFKPNNEKGNENKKDQKNKRKRGGQPGHTGVTRSLLPTEEVDHVERHQPPEHCDCGGSIESSECYQRHQVHELPEVKMVVTEHQLFCGCCAQCGKEHRAELPDHVPTGMLGPYLLAFIATLTSDYKMSKRDVARFLMDLYQFSLCIATVKRAEETVSEALKTPVEAAKAYVKQETIVNCDETSHAECGKRMWTWVAIANTVAVFMIAASRSKKAAMALLGETFNGILGSDRYRAYAWVPAHCRQVCWAHLKRDFKKISEREGSSRRLGVCLLGYTQRLFHAWHQLGDGIITREEFKKIMGPIRQKVERLLVFGTQLEHSKTKGTCLEMIKLKEALWTFVETVNVEPTNNLAERVLRKIVIWRKVCFGTWSVNGTLYLERVMTVVATCRLQEKSVFGFLRDAMIAHLHKTPAPSLLPQIILATDIASLKAA